MTFTQEELEEDLKNEEEFLIFFEKKNLESLQDFAGNKRFNSLSDCFLIRHYDAMPRIGLSFLSTSCLQDELLNQIVAKYKLLFGKWAKYDVDKKR